MINFVSMFWDDTRNFISWNDERSVTIDGNAPGAPEIQRTNFYDGGKAVQLRRARTEESGFNWPGQIKSVSAKNVVIYDEIDVKCLAWFIDRRILIDFSLAYVAPEAVDTLVATIEEFKKRDIKVVEGSAIRLPSVGNLMGPARAEEVKITCADLGFTIYVYTFEDDQE